MRVAYADLPQELKDSVKEILRHRKRMLPWIGFVSLPAAVTLLAQFSRRPKVGDIQYDAWVGGHTVTAADVEQYSKLITYIPSGLALASAISGYFALRTHDPAFAKEYKKLFLNLRHSRDPQVRAILLSQHSHFLRVNRDGSISTQEKMPKYFFGMPLGRRVVANPYSTKENIRAWTKKMNMQSKKKRLAKH